MRVFQVGNIYPAHLSRIRPSLSSFDSERDTNAAILADVAQAQILAPCISEDPEGRLCFPQYEIGLRHWARGMGLPAQTALDDIVLAQIEHHRTEVFYSVNSISHSESFLTRMPGCVRLKIGWLGSKMVGNGLRHFDAIVSNFLTLNRRHARAGLPTRYLTPSYETQTDRVGFVTWSERNTDLFFAGTYSRHHRNRARLIEDIASMLANENMNADLRLLGTRYIKLVETTPLGFFPPFSKLRRPHIVRRFANSPVFGREMFGLLGSAKSVVNMAIDIAGPDRGNMRCFETLSAGSLLISDDGDYPEGFEDGVTHRTYRSNDQALEIVNRALNEPEETEAIARRGWEMIRRRFSKETQWSDFTNLCASIGP